jgi:hypothetical protein
LIIIIIITSILHKKSVKLENKMNKNMKNNKRNDCPQEGSIG